MATTSYSQLISAAARWRKCEASSRESQHATRVALIGNSTLQFLPPALEYVLAMRGVPARFYVGQFDNYLSDVLSDDSPLYAFQPQVVVLLLDHHVLPPFTDVKSGWNGLDQAVAAQTQQWQILWEKIRQRTGAAVVQSNIALPCESPLGHVATKLPSLTSLIRRLNDVLAREAPSTVSILDVEQLSAVVGKQIWFDAPTWYTSKQSFSFNALPTLANNLAAILAALLGKTRKCLVLDLDNTLWGNVIGDVGVHGIQLGAGDPIGEAHRDFQRYCLKLKERGVLLAVCSKNELKNAQEPFENHPDTVLRLTDFSAFIANWDDKATNLRRIAAQLNIGLDSLVFVDDNPVERDLVRSQLPEVAVPEMPADPAHYARTLDFEHLFEVTTISADDEQRTQYYLENQQREQLLQSATNLDEFLKTLDQECLTGPIDDSNRARVVQLLNKTNQWNLTTRRFSEGEIAAIQQDPAVFSLCVRSKDRFGDNGLISVVIAREVNGEFDIEDWVMSCRVFNRGIEDLVFNELLFEAQSRGLQFLTGTYRETAKNELVRRLYERLGFTCLDEGATNVTRWRLPLSSQITPRPHQIRQSRFAISRPIYTTEQNNESRAA